MSLTKADIVQAVAEWTGLPLKQSASGRRVSTIEIMKRVLASGEDVLVSGVGKFEVRGKERAAGTKSGHRRGHDATGSAGGYIQKLGETTAGC